MILKNEIAYTDFQERVQLLDRMMNRMDVNIDNAWKIHDGLLMQHAISGCFQCENTALCTDWLNQKNAARIQESFCPNFELIHYFHRHNSDSCVIDDKYMNIQ